MPVLSFKMPSQLYFLVKLLCNAAVYCSQNRQSDFDFHYYNERGSYYLVYFSVFTIFFLCLACFGVCCRYLIIDFLICFFLEILDVKFET